MTETTDQEHFEGMTLDELIQHCHRTAKDKGWWDDHAEGDERVFPEKAMLMVTEISEAVEHWRQKRMGGIQEIFIVEPDGGVTDVTHHPNPQINKNTKPDGALVELADVLIRILDLCGRFDMNLSKAVALKMRFNELRPFRHGGKRA